MICPICKKNLNPLQAVQIGTSDNNVKICKICSQQIKNIKREPTEKIEEYIKSLNTIINNNDERDIIIDDILGTLQDKKNELIKKREQEEAINSRLENVIVTTADLKEDYEIIGPVYYQISNKGLFSALDSKIAEYRNDIQKMKSDGTMSKTRADWGFLYGEWSVGQNYFEQAFYVATQELKKRAIVLGADAIIGMRQDIDLDTSAFQYFYLQMYGTAVKRKNN